MFKDCKVPRICYNNQCATMASLPEFIAGTRYMRHVSKVQFALSKQHSGESSMAVLAVMFPTSLEGVMTGVTTFPVESGIYWPIPA